MRNRLMLLVVVGLFISFANVAPTSAVKTSDDVESKIFLMDLSAYVPSIYSAAVEHVLYKYCGEKSPSEISVEDLYEIVQTRKFESNPALLCKSKLPDDISSRVAYEQALYGAAIAYYTNKACDKEIKGAADIAREELKGITSNAEISELVSFLVKGDQKEYERKLTSLCR